MELTKRDNQMAQGVAILAMLMLHLFCRREDLPYEPLLWIGSVPFIYYLGLFGDLCVPAYCFCSGYAQIVLKEKEQNAYGKRRFHRLLKFLLNFWVVLVLFAVVGFFFDQSGEIPGTVTKFLGNALLYGLSYNGAWWFVLTYVWLVLLSPVFIWLTEKLHPMLLFLISGTAYFAAYVFRFVIILEFDFAVVSWLWQQVILLGTSQFSFVVGMLCHRYKVVSKFRMLRQKSKVGTALCVVVPAIMFALHCVEVSLIIAPITGLTTLLCFHVFPKPEWMCKLFAWIGEHSTNIWLVHMFFYLELFEGLAYRGRYPLFVFLMLFGISLAVSYVVSAIYWPAVALVDRKND